MKSIGKKHGKVYIFFKWFFRILLMLILLSAVIFHKTIYDTGRVLLGQHLLEKGAKGLKYSERSLTKEQMLTDFDYLYRNSCTDSLVREQAEKYLGADYDSIYRTYRTRIENCGDEYEFAAVMSSFMAKLPGVHGGVFPPAADLNASMSGFPLFWELAYNDVRETNYAYWIQFKDRMLSYTQKSAVACNYGGDYVFIEYSYGNDTIDDITNGRLLSLNGEPIRTAVRDLDTVHKWKYDESGGCVRVSNLIFNDSIGKEYDAEIEMPDGSIIHKTLYNSAEYNFAVQYRRKYYPDDTGNSGDPGKKNGSKKCYTIETDGSRRLVYVKNDSCDYTQADMFFKEMTAALNETDAENIIIDVRSNGGGSADFVTKGLCRAIFDKDTGFTNYSLMPKTDITELFWKNKFMGLLWEFEDKDGLIRYSDDFTAEGEAAKKYNIYILMSASTFSSGDIFTSIAEAEDNVTLLGENTGGEGLTGSPLTLYLPESKLPFTFTPGISENKPGDNYIGTSPDICCPNAWEDYLGYIEMLDDPDIGSKAGSLEYRYIWDKPFKEAIKIIDSRSQ